MSVELSKGRFLAALVIAVASDAVSIWAEMVMPVQWAVDLATAALLFAILGRRWQLLPALVAEAIPGVAAFPSWVLVVVAIRMTKKPQVSPVSPAVPDAPDAPRKHVENEAKG
jgi:hypothetical protein